MAHTRIVILSWHHLTINQSYLQMQQKYAGVGKVSSNLGGNSYQCMNIDLTLCIYAWTGYLQISTHSWLTASLAHVACPRVALQLTGVTWILWSLQAGLWVWVPPGMVYMGRGHRLCAQTAAFSDFFAWMLRKPHCSVWRSIGRLVWKTRRFSAHLIQYRSRKR